MCVPTDFRFLFGTDFLRLPSFFFHRLAFRAFFFLFFFSYNFQAPRTTNAAEKWWFGQGEGQPPRASEKGAGTTAKLTRQRGRAV